MFTQITVNSHNRQEFIDITSKINNVVRRSEVVKGLLVLNVPHTTAGITINENADPDVKDDILTKLTEMIPVKDNYQHREGNSDAHIKSCLLGSDQTIIINNNGLVLGHWQGIYFCEFDGPRSRKINLKIIED